MTPAQQPVSWLYFHVAPKLCMSYDMTLPRIYLMLPQLP